LEQLEKGPVTLRRVPKPLPLCPQELQPQEEQLLVIGTPPFLVVSVYYA
jgi:hypothetical protein